MFTLVQDRLRNQDPLFFAVLVLVLVPVPLPYSVNKPQATKREPTHHKNQQDAKYASDSVRYNNMENHWISEQLYCKN